MAMRLQLLLAATERDGDIGAVTEKIELALFLEGRLGPMPSSRLPGSVISAECVRKVLAAGSLSPGLRPNNNLPPS
jgi:hypothetical protein